MSELEGALSSSRRVAHARAVGTLPYEPLRRLRRPARVHRVNLRREVSSTDFDSAGRQTAMGSKNEMTRKEFLMLTFTLWARRRRSVPAASDNNNVDASFGGNNGSGRDHRRWRHDGNRRPRRCGRHDRSGRQPAAPPRPRARIRYPRRSRPSDHTHTVTIPASTLNATTAQTVRHRRRGPAHMHMVTLQPAQLTTLKGGGSVTVTSSRHRSARAHVHDQLPLSCRRDVARTSGGLRAARDRPARPRPTRSRRCAATRCRSTR